MSKKEQKPSLPSGANSSKAGSNYPEQERESLRLGHEAATRETVKGVVEDKNCHGKARSARFESTQEPSEAPDHDDAVKERAVTASKGSKSGKK